MDLLPSAYLTPSGYEGSYGVCIVFFVEVLITSRGDVKYVRLYNVVRDMH
jgi:hypothetical protein